MNDGCPKCGHRETARETVSMTESGLSELFGGQTNRFLVISCVECGYSEFYRKSDSETSALSELFR
ncbi:hypothetical protein EIK79_03760 [Halocatena pleomorpha]|uniref:Nucleic acid-binding protein n=2 Tax=Halocatena pleomorpha TaxID=1785090 RepID=A0A3P3RJ68_9EURY|nr:hypothetical protein EIK79_03760 [Halocatena pleomorpha]